MMRVYFAENALIAEKSAGTRRKNARSAKVISKVVALEKVKGAIPTMVAPERFGFFVE